MNCQIGAYDPTAIIAARRTTVPALPVQLTMAGDVHLSVFLTVDEAVDLVDAVASVLAEIEAAAAKESPVATRR